MLRGEEMTFLGISRGCDALDARRHKAVFSGVTQVLGSIYLQVGQHHLYLVCFTPIPILRALTVFWNASQERVWVVVLLLAVLFVHPLDLGIELLDEAQFFLRFSVLLLKLIVLELETPYCYFEQLVFTFAVHCTVLVELVLWLLRLKFLLPNSDFFP